MEATNTFILLRSALKTDLQSASSSDGVCVKHAGRALAAAAVGTRGCKPLHTRGGGRVGQGKAAGKAVGDRESSNWGSEHGEQLLAILVFC